MDQDQPKIYPPYTTEEPVKSGAYSLEDEEQEEE